MILFQISAQLEVQPIIPSKLAPTQDDFQISNLIYLN